MLCELDANHIRAQIRVAEANDILRVFWLFSSANGRPSTTRLHPDKVAVAKELGHAIVCHRLGQCLLRAEVDRLTFIYEELLFLHPNVVERLDLDVRFFR